jgi:hypothetical protein
METMQKVIRRTFGLTMSSPMTVNILETPSGVHAETRKQRNIFIYLFLFLLHSIKESLPALVRNLFTFSSKVIKSFIIV